MHIYICKAFLATYQNIHTYLQGILATYPTYIYICKAFFGYLSKHTYIFARHFCYLSSIHTYLRGIFATFLTYIHTCKAFFCATYHSILNGISTPFWMAFLRYMFTFYLHVCTYTWETILCYIFMHIHIHLKSNFCATYSIFLKGNFMSYIHILRSILVLHSTYIRILQGTLLPTQHMHALFERYFLLLPILYIYTCTLWRNFLHHLNTKYSTRCSPNQVLVKGKPH